MFVLFRSVHGQEVSRLKQQLDISENEIIRLQLVIQQEQVS